MADDNDQQRMAEIDAKVSNVLPGVGIAYGRINTPSTEYYPLIEAYIARYVKMDAPIPEMPVLPVEGDVEDERDPHAVLIALIPHLLADIRRLLMVVYFWQSECDRREGVRPDA